MKTDQQRLRDKISYDRLRSATLNLGYKFFEDGTPYDLNIIGVRNKNRDQSKDKFDDFICVLWLDETRYERIAVLDATTDPGLAHMTDPIFKAAIKDGTAILVEGQYRRAYTLGHHGRGSYRHRALQQTGRVNIYRDDDVDNELDMDPMKQSSGWFGINIHAASLWTDVPRIGRYSAGCQVVQKKEQFDRLIRLCEMQGIYGMGLVFTYTLLKEEQL